MRNVDSFDTLWKRRNTVVDDAGTQIEIMAIDDLVRAKETQRDKDWTMIRRLVEAHFASQRDNSNEDQRKFWLREGRTADPLVDLAKDHPKLAAAMIVVRPLCGTRYPETAKLLRQAFSRSRKLGDKLTGCIGYH